MKTAEINWELFWQVASQQTNAEKNSWLGRWAFADDSVKLSMQPARTETDDAIAALATRCPIALAGEGSEGANRDFLRKTARPASSYLPAHASN